MLEGLKTFHIMFEIFDFMFFGLELVDIIFEGYEIIVFCLKD